MPQDYVPGVETPEKFSVKRDDIWSLTLPGSLPLGMKIQNHILPSVSEKLSPSSDHS
jgi:hypothetical protein